MISQIQIENLIIHIICENLFFQCVCIIFYAIIVQYSSDVSSVNLRKFTAV